ncbi:MAG: phospho-sugar mutase [Micrococcales bacterium]
MAGIDVVAAAKQWLAQDPDPQTHSELALLIETGNLDELEARFGSRLQFGTAGLRGELGAGSNRMNRVLVGQAAAGIAAWLKAAGGDTALGLPAQPSVVIGFDGRLNSDVFAKDSARILAGAGVSVTLFDDYVPTPVLAFAVKHGGFSAGIMVTASHNPPRDNGYKVYLGGANGGSQIVPPVDAQIEAQILQVAATTTFAELAKSDDFVIGGAQLIEAYLERTARLVSGGSARKPVKSVYTAMHGVGWKTLSALFDRVGLEQPAVVEQQLHPNGSFPTVAFPNPEEPGAMDLSFERGNAVGAELDIANDPDADRLAIAVADCSFGSGWRKFTGDEIGLLLGAEAAERAHREGRKGALACSIVSSSALSGVAKHYGLDFVQTLTGFKWISKVPNLIFGYEEALGYCVDPQATPDKDGISAALVLADLAGRLAAQGSSLEQRLAQLGNQFGHFATGQISLRFDTVQVAKDKVAALRQNPPETLAGQAAVFTDMALGSAELPPTDGLRFDLSDGRRVIVRPSGTEPKLKCYLQAVGDSAAEAKTLLAQLEFAMKQVL